jgi:ABC-type multidrug transport system fused ATPase/permease subunit
MPELTTMAIDAFVSVKRIQSYLQAPEISINTKDSPDISFDDVSIAWPSDEEKKDGDERYVLRDISVSFPNRELSVVTGKTGSGKSLLLAAILGEVDVLKGSINVPKPPHERYDQKATKDNWIIPNSIAFVAQIPWIENASIKDNILFGLPFDENRYNKTVEVCALGKDLEMLPDGEATEVGSNGVNLSGGQKWRVTFARVCDRIHVRYFY